MIRLAAVAGALALAASVSSAAPVAAPHGALTRIQVVDVEAVLASSSPDGRTVYTASGRSDSMRVFRRAASGKLTRVARRAGCVSRSVPPSPSRRCTAGGAINGPTSLVTSNDGGSVLLSSWTGRQHVALFRRTARTGALRLLSCLGEVTEGVACSPGGRRTTGAVALSPDGRFGYLTAREGPKKITIFAVEDGGETLHEVGCVGRAGSATCTPVRTSRFNPTALAVSPDGRNLYVTSSTATDQGVIFAFARNRQTGLVTPLAGAGACLSSSVATCGTLKPMAFRGAGEGSPGGALVISRDGRVVVVGGFAPTTVKGIVIAVGRDPATGVLTSGGCAGAGSGCASARVLSGVGSVAIAADARTVYAGTFDGLVVLRLKANLSLSQLAGKYGCYVRLNPGGCSSLPRPIGGVSSLTVSRDGRSVYAAAGRLVVFRSER